MTDRKWFTPAEGMTIPHPHTRLVVPAKGQWVHATDEFFIRREMDGGGTLSDAPPEGAEED